MTSSTTLNVHSFHQNDQDWFRVVDMSREFSFMSSTHITKHTAPENIIKDAHQVNYVNVAGLQQVANHEFRSSRLKMAADNLRKWLSEKLFSGAALDDGSEGYIAGEMTQAEAEEISKGRYAHLSSTTPKENMTTAAPTTPSTTNTVESFDFHGNQIRIVMKDGNPWFVLSDLAKVMKISHVTNLKKRLDQAGCYSAEVEDSRGNRVKTTAVNKANMYRVIMRSDKAEAIKFQNWVTDVVLVELDEKGTYSIAPQAEAARALPANYVEALEALVQSERDKLKLEEERKKAVQSALVWEDKAEREESKSITYQAQAKKMEPKAAAFDEWINGQGVYLLGNAAKIIDQGRDVIGQNRLFQFLRDEGILMSGGSRHNIPKQKFAKHFKVKTRTGMRATGEDWVSMTTYVKPSGVAFIADRLRHNGWEI